MYKKLNDKQLRNNYNHYITGSGLDTGTYIKNIC